MRILYEDANVLVIDKPAGLSVHARAGGEPEITVADWARKRVKDTDKERPGIVHRLDKDTSGVLIIAKSPKIKKFLQAQFKDRLVKKRYITLVHGHLPHAEAIIKLPLGRHPKNPFKRSVLGHGKEASTRYKVKKQYKDYSLLEVYPQTGRTHQIRVHLAHIGHPVVGDDQYGRHKDLPIRQFLHAHKLSITLPDGKVHNFTSPLAADLKHELKNLS